LFNNLLTDFVVRNWKNGYFRKSERIYGKVFLDKEDV
jgi:hypothetical protein